MNWRDPVTRVRRPALLLAAPLMAAVALLVRLTSSGPALFRQVRIGHRKTPFTMLKFRTMYVDSDDSEHRAFVTAMLRSEDPRTRGDGRLCKLEQDPRITPFGRFLRRSSLDELPQLINVVLRGDMSLVGPRPALAWETSRYEPHHHERFLMRPGITGIWQVSGRSSLSMTQALELDVQYVRSRSLALNLAILLLTMPAVLGWQHAQ